MINDNNIYIIFDFTESIKLDFTKLNINPKGSIYLFVL